MDKPKNTISTVARPWNSVVHFKTLFEAIYLIE